jgi:hypothetical protein
MDPKDKVARQRQLLNKRLGLDVAGGIGLETDDLFKDEDLLEKPSELPKAEFVPQVGICVCFGLEKWGVYLVLLHLVGHRASTEQCLLLFCRRFCSKVLVSVNGSLAACTTWEELWLNITYRKMNVSLFFFRKQLGNLLSST